MKDFQRVAVDIIPNLVQVLLKDYPRSTLPINFLKQYLRCSTAAPQLDIRLFTPGGEVDSFGTFLIYIPQHLESIVFHTLDTDLKSFKQKLCMVKDINWSALPIIGPVDECFHKMIIEIAEEENLKIIPPLHPAHNLVMNKEDALKFEIQVPEGMEIREITTEDAQFVNSNWPHKEENSLQFIYDCILTGGGIALIHQESREMLCWSLHSLVGGPGMIKTAPEHCGKGYGSVVGKAQSQLVAEIGFTPSIQIECGNRVSLAMFRKMGYKETHKVYWINCGKVK